MKILSFFSTLFKPLRWFISSFEDSTGKTSGSLLTAWFLTMLAGYYAITDKIQNEYSLIAFVSILAAVLLLWGVIKWKDIETLTKQQGGGNHE